MKAVRIHAFGGPDVLQIEELSIPEPRKGEFLVKVQAAGVNPVDYKIREGKYPPVKEGDLPLIMGRDISGLIAASGSGTSDELKEGDAIYAMLAGKGGGYAEYALVAKEAARKPAAIDYVAAAATPLAGLTAWQGLFRYGKLEPGQRVLIHGGAGGVGHFAIQFAKAKGAFVITTAAKDDLDFVRSIGADEAINYKEQRFEEAVHDVDMVFDLIAGETQQRSFSVLKRGGVLVSTLTEPDQEKARAHGVRGLRYTVQENAADLDEIAQLIDDRKVKPKVGRIFTLNEAAKAQVCIAEGDIQGKVVLRISD
ncbi:MAG TPA: NADP-dependent oxidoreductase [Methylovirgula sp.]|nr:NADP-dependent oxidoreductase [Methylovirgula sp.]